MNDTQEKPSPDYESIPDPGATNLDEMLASLQNLATAIIEHVREELLRLENETFFNYFHSSLNTATSYFVDSAKKNNPDFYEETKLCLEGLFRHPCYEFSTLECIKTVKPIVSEYVALVEKIEGQIVPILEDEYPFNPSVRFRSARVLFPELRPQITPDSLFDTLLEQFPNNIKCITEITSTLELENIITMAREDSDTANVLVESFLTNILSTFQNEGESSSQISTLCDFVKNFLRKHIPGLQSSMSDSRVLHYDNNPYSSSSASYPNFSYASTPISNQDNEADLTQSKGSPPPPLKL